jgi:hypothetical protein
MMNRNDQILLFLGRFQARIEDLGELASNSESHLFSLISDLEMYFNKSIHEIFSQKETENSTWRRGVSWNTLPR